MSVDVQVDTWRLKTRPGGSGLGFRSHVQVGV